MPENKKQNKKNMSLNEAWQLVKHAAALGYKQGAEQTYLRQAYRMIIASRIRTERTAAKMTQEEVSNKIGTNALTYRGYENCKSDIPIAYLVRIADVFQVSMDYLTGRTDIPGKPETTQEERIRKIEEALGLNNG